MNNCRSLTLRVGRIWLDSESQATSMGQLFMRRSLANAGKFGSSAESVGGQSGFAAGALPQTPGFSRHHSDVQ